MSLKNHEYYYLTINENELTLDSFSETMNQVKRALKEYKGKILLSADDGKRPWWQRFIFGAHRYVCPYFMCEWSGDVNGLIFYDDNGSEYRVVAVSNINDVNEDDRNNVTFGEESAIAPKYCIDKNILLNAIDDFFEHGQKPLWLDYDFIR